MERPTDGNRQDARAGNGEHGSEAARQQAERFAESGREGMRRATKASMAAASGAARSGSALAEGAPEITAAWARYAEEVMRHTFEASQALLRAQTFNGPTRRQSSSTRMRRSTVHFSVRTLAEVAMRVPTARLSSRRTPGRCSARAASDAAGVRPG
jgi:Phasin protein